MSTTLEQPQTQAHPKALWDRYTELTAKPELSDDEQDEASRLKARLQLPPELADVLLSEADRLEALARREVTIEAAYQSAVEADNAARQAMIDEISRLQLRLQNGDYPERQACLDAQRLHDEALHGRSQLSMLFRHWPELFGLPGPGRSNTSDHISSLPVVIQETLRKYGQTLAPYVSPHRQESNSHADMQDAPSRDFIAHPWGGQ